MLKRRSLLIGTGILTLNALLAGCQSESKAALKIRLLQGSIPPQLLKAFQRQLQDHKHQNHNVAFQASSQLADLFRLLQTWKNPNAAPKSQLNLPNVPIPGKAKPPAVADLITLGDFWLTGAIQQELIQPLPLDTIPGWQQLPPAWQQLVRRDRQGQLSSNGELWAAPYRWGSLMIAYNVEAFESLNWKPMDWADLWRSDVMGQISLPDSARSVIGLTLKKLGQSVNTANLETLPNLLPELQALQRQVKFYSSDAYLQPLVLQDTWMTVGWSTEILPLLERDRRIAAVVPSSGTILTADLWVRPAPASPTSPSAPAASPSPATSPSPISPAPTTSPAAQPPVSFERWIEFCWQPATANQLALLGSAASPVLTGVDRSQLPAKLQKNALLLPPAEVLAKSEFLLPIANSDQFQRLWEQLRQTG